jgi:hypothetical protein
MRTMHGDVAYHHRRYRHDDTDLLCACGKDKPPDHLAHYPRVRRCFRQWSMRPIWPPDDTKAGIMYLQQLLSKSEDSIGFLRIADGA